MHKLYLNLIIFSHSPCKRNRPAAADKNHKSYNNILEL